MKKLIYLIPIFLMCLTSCEKENIDVVVIDNDTIRIDTIINDNDTVNFDTVNNNIVIDTLKLIKHEWVYYYSAINDSIIDLEIALKYYLKPDSSFNLNYKSSLIYSNEFGLYDFNLFDNERRNIINDTYDYTDSVRFRNGKLYWYDYFHGNYVYSIKCINDSALTLSYISILNHNQIAVYLKKK